jgi:hypothetical protein
LIKSIPSIPPWHRSSSSIKSPLCTAPNLPHHVHDHLRVSSLRSALLQIFRTMSINAAPLKPIFTLTSPMAPSLNRSHHGRASTEYPSASSIIDATLPISRSARWRSQQQQAAGALHQIAANHHESHRIESSVRTMAEPTRTESK